MNTVYQRTSKGDEEIKKRIYKLDHEHRFVLIMIDGKADVANIIARSSEQWKPKQCLFEMETQGFIENINKHDRTKTGLNVLKQDLIISAQKLLPNNYTKIVNNIINADMNIEELSKVIIKSCVLIKLTVCEKTASQLKHELLNILNSSNEL